MIPETVSPHDLTGVLFLIWEVEPAPRHGRGAPLVERLAPARARFQDRFGRPPALVLLPAPEPVAGVDLPVRVYRGVGRGHLWLEERGAVTWVLGNVDRDAAAELRIAIHDWGVRASAYTADDFVL